VNGGDTWFVQNKAEQMEVLRRSAAVYARGGGDASDESHPSSPRHSKPGSPAHVAVTAGVHQHHHRLLSGHHQHRLHHSDSDDEVDDGSAFPIDLSSSGGGSSHRSSSADEGAAGCRHSPPLGGQQTDDKHFGRNGDLLLDLTSSRSQSAGEFQSKVRKLP
jgi:hypothetical protein